MDGRADRRLRGASLLGRLSPLFPSDLATLAPTARTLLLAGRVFAADAERVELADAFSLAAVTGKFGALAPGDLVILKARWEKRVLSRGRLQERKQAPLPRGDGDVGRFLFDGVGPRLQARSRALAAVRSYFLTRGFIEVETPLRVPAPGVDSHVEAMRAEGGWLITSPELEMKRLVVAGVPRQFQLARVTRRDESGSLHEAEFTLLEWYRAFAGQDEVLADTEAVVRTVARQLRGKLELVAPDGRIVPVKGAFERLRVRDAFRKFAGVTDVADLAASDEARYFELFVSRVEPELARFPVPLFLHQYPLSQAALARPLRDAPNYAERFELYVAGVELCNGYGELTDPVEQAARFRAERARRKAQGQTAYPLNRRFLAALSEGMPETGGNALGIDRLLMLALGARHIKDVIAFPRDALG